MTLVVASAAVLGFALVLARSRLGGVVQRIVRAALDGVTVVLDPDLDDLAKERAARRAGVSLLKGGFGLAWRFGLALGAAGLVVLAADASGVVPADRVLDLMVGLDFIVGISVVAAVVWWADISGVRRDACSRTDSTLAGEASRARRSRSMPSVSRGSRIRSS